MKMNIKSLGTLVALGFLTGGCNKSPTSPIANNTDSPRPPAIQAEPFQGQVYKSLNGKTVLTLVSKDECELAERGTTLLCRYTKPNNTLRIVTTALGTSQVIYFRFTDQGLEDSNGDVLLSPEKYTAAIKMLNQRQREEEKQELEKQRVAEVLANSIIETRTLSTFSLAQKLGVGQGGTTFPTEGSVILTDVSLKFRTIDHFTFYDGKDNEDVLFSQVKRIGDVGDGTSRDAFVLDADPIDRVSFYTGARPAILYFKSEAEAQTVHDAMLKAFNEWKQKFPEAVLR